MDIYSTLTRSKENFETINKNRVNLFVCGPTVYDDAHIGHGRTYISFDTIKRYLEYSGYAVFYIQNITDIDDKIINRSKESGIPASDIVKVMMEFTLKLKNLKNLENYQIVKLMNWNPTGN